jgi:hypothetical protein
MQDQVDRTDKGAIVPAQGKVGTQYSSYKSKIYYCTIH